MSKGKDFLDFISDLAAGGPQFALVGGFKDHLARADVGKFSDWFKIHGYSVSDADIKNLINKSQHKRSESIMPLVGY